MAFTKFESRPQNNNPSMECNLFVLIHVNRYDWAIWSQMKQDFQSTNNYTRRHFSARLFIPVWINDVIRKSRKTLLFSRLTKVSAVLLQMTRVTWQCRCTIQKCIRRPSLFLHPHFWAIRKYTYSKTISWRQFKFNSSSSVKRFRSSENFDFELS